MQSPTLPFGRFLSRAALVSSALFLMGFGGPGLFAGPVAQADEKAAKAMTVHDVWSLPGIFGGGVKTTDDYTEGNVFLVLPVISTVGQDGLLSGDVLFIEPYSSWGEQGEVAASLGLGWRHYFTTQSVSAVTRHDGHQAGFFEEGVYVGANVFVDMLDTQFDNQFWQLGVGVEVGTRYLEIRGNYYIPLSDRQLALERRTRQTFQSSSVSTSQGVTGSAPFATGNTIQQDVQFTSFATTTTSTTTIEQLFRLYEEGMEGWDVQASLLVPGLDRWMDVFLIGGYYSFDNQPFGPQTGGTGNVEGWKAGVEVRPVPAVVLNATWYEDERFVGSEWLYGLRLEIPFEMGDLGDGKGFWDRVGESFKPRRRHLAERLVEPVRRQNQAIQVGNDVEEKVDVDTSVKRVTKVVSQSSQRIVLLDDVVFVNNGGPTGNGIQQGNATGTGTAEQPVDTLQVGTNIALVNTLATNRLWNVYTQGGTPYANGTLVGPGGSLKFIGSSIPIAGLGGRSFGTGQPQIIQGQPPFFQGIAGGQGGQYLGVFGYTFDGTNLAASNYQRVEFVGNVILRNQLLVGTFGSGSSEALIANNIIADVSGAGMGINASDTSNLYAEILNNTVSGAIALSTSGGGSARALVQGNTVNGTNGGIIGTVVGGVAGAGLDLTIVSNRITNPNNAFGAGIQFLSLSNGSITAKVFDNVITGGAAGIGLFLTSADPMDIQIESNTIFSPNLTGILLTTSSSNMTARINRNTILNVSSPGAGIRLTAQDGSDLDVLEFNGNTVNSPLDLRHIELIQEGTGILNVNGTVNNVAQPSPNPSPGGATLGVTGTPSGSFLLNGALITLPVSVP
ncbi:MAG: inverse autotransporter beta domain-containing protein [Roseimicrobium sp.]